MKNLAFIFLFLLAFQSIAQKNKNTPPPKKAEYTIPLTPDKWTFQEGKVTFPDYKDKKTMKLATNSGQVVLKDILFKDGTIEFDIEPLPQEFAHSIYFHRKDLKEQEIVYLRGGKMGSKLANEGIQYAPYLDGVNMWDMYHEYQAPAMIKKGEWNHMKLIISGSRLQVFLNHSSAPVLDIPKLEGTMSEGSIAFEGTAYIANVQLKPNETEGLSPLALPDLSEHDGYFLRKWAVSAPYELPVGTELSSRNLPQPDKFTDSIVAERRGLVNLTRRYGASPSRRTIWLKTKIVAKEAVKTNLQLGFSDEVWVFLNNQMVLVDKNLFSQGMRKYPDGRISIQNTLVNLSLKEGENDLLIGVSNDFYGWGIMARLESAEGILETDKIAGIITLAREIATMNLDPLLGTYSTGDIPLKLTFSKKDKVLVVQPSGQQPADLLVVGNNTFAFTNANAIFEFDPDKNTVILRQGNEKREFKKE